MVTLKFAIEWHLLPR